MDPEGRDKFTVSACGSKSESSDTHLIRTGVPNKVVCGLQQKLQGIYYAPEEIHRCMLYHESTCALNLKSLNPCRVFVGVYRV